MTKPAAVRRTGGELASTRRPLLALARAAAAILLLCPFAFVCLASVLPEQSLFGGAKPGGSAGLFHYRELFRARGFATPLRNSLYVAGGTTALCVGLGALAAYALARLEFRGKRGVFGLLLAVSAFPQISVVEPLYALLRELGLINTYPGLVLAYVTFTLPISVLLLVSFFRELPREVEQAARMDGATSLQVLWHVILPLSVPGLVATGIISFVYCWNEFLFALSFTVGGERQTLPVAIAMLRGRHQ
ncbi:MAG TPA: carbohydrate ABC transporter permease, partial [Polyangiaceae bacterium]|nr:carbohydrate ABC transporter permease [Polyangiaceae bacterium]